MFPVLQSLHGTDEDNSMQLVQTVDVYGKIENGVRSAGTHVQIREPL